MDISDVYVGMVCDTKQGTGKVTGVDVRLGQIYLSDTQDNHNFNVSYEELIENPQVHNCSDTYY